MYANAPTTPATIPTAISLFLYLLGVCPSLSFRSRLCSFSLTIFLATTAASFVVFFLFCHLNICIFLCVLVRTKVFSKSLERCFLLYIHATNRTVFLQTEHDIQ